MSDARPPSPEEAESRPAVQDGGAAAPAPAAAEGHRMTIREHLDELRSRIIKALYGVLVGFVVAFWKIDAIFAFLRRPLDEAIAAQPQELRDSVELIQTEIHGAFWASMKVAFFSGLLFALPVVAYQMWAFVAAGLHKHERRSVKYYVVPGLLLFLLGSAIAYLYVIPFAFDFLIGWAEGHGEAKSLLNLPDYVSLVSFALFAFGLMFQLPLIMVFLMRMGVVEPKTFGRFRRHAIVASFFLAMIATPPDVVSQIALAVCLIVLYEAAILVGARVARKRRAAEESE